MAGRDLVTCAEGAASLRRHPRTLRRWLRAGAFPGAKVGGRWRLRWADLDAHLAGRGEAPADPSGGGPCGSRVVIFRDAAAAHRCWLGAHPRGYVLSPATGVLHRSTCSLVAVGRSARARLTAAEKWCSADRAELAARARTDGRRGCRPCRRCLASEPPASPPRPPSGRD